MDSSETITFVLLSGLSGPFYGPKSVKRVSPGGCKLIRRDLPAGEVREDFMEEGLLLHLGRGQCIGDQQGPWAWLSSTLPFLES